MSAKTKVTKTKTALKQETYNLSFFLGEAVLMMELPRRHSTPPRGGRFAPIKSSNYGGRPLTGPSPEDLSEAGLAELFG